MKELSLHILDIVQNSLHAGASEISISVVEDFRKNLLSIQIGDNGKGIPEDKLMNLLDPFFTTKKKKTGLGIPMLKQHAEMAGGDLQVESKVGKGTILTATFQHDNLDRQPMGDLTGTIIGLIRANPEICWKYKHRVNEREFLLDTNEIKAELDDVPINSREVLNFIEEFIRDNLNELST